MLEPALKKWNSKSCPLFVLERQCWTKHKTRLYASSITQAELISNRWLKPSELELSISQIYCAGKWERTVKHVNKQQHIVSTYRDPPSRCIRAGVVDSLLQELWVQPKVTITSLNLEESSRGDLENGLSMQTLWYAARLIFKDLHSKFTLVLISGGHSVQFRHSVMSTFLQPCGLQHT